LTASVDSGITHSSYLTRIPDEYTGLDITNGMWIMATDNPQSLRIDSIISQTDTSITCIIEDVNRFNTFNDTTSSGNGIFSTSPNTQIIFFQLGDDGLPIFVPLPSTINLTDSGFLPNLLQVEARFRVFNPTNEVQLYQIDNGFVEGDVVTMDSTTGLFRNVTSDDIFVLGTVTAVGPGPNYFYLGPTSKVITDLEPSLPGPVGGIVWIDPSTGNITSSSTSSNASVYMKVTEAVPSFTISSIEASDLSIYNTFGFSINLVQMVIAGTSPDPQPVSYLIDLINSFTVEHGVVAQMGSQPNIVTGTVSAPTATLQGSNMQFSINGVTVTVAPPSIIFGAGSEVGWWDFVRSINELVGQTGVYATVDNTTGDLILTNNFGSAINIENIVPASTSGGYQCFTDACGFTVSNPAGPANYLQLVRSDGGPIVITDTQSTGSYLISSSGITSAANGSLPMALVVDQSMYANTNYIVPNIAGLNTLTNMRVGDQVYVQADANGQWAMYLYTASGWVEIANQASASTDASSLQVVITPSSPVSQSIGVVSLDSTIISVMVQVTVPFTADAVLTIGTSSVVDAIMPASNIDLTTIGNYEIDPSFIYESTAPDFNVDVYFTVGSATTGSATVIVSYL
jgi:hypothetical protein